MFPHVDCPTRLYTFNLSSLQQLYMYCLMDCSDPLALFHNTFRVNIWGLPLRYSISIFTLLSGLVGSISFNKIKEDTFCPGYKKPEKEIIFSYFITSSLGLLKGRTWGDFLLAQNSLGVSGNRNFNKIRDKPRFFSFQRWIR